MGKVKQKNWLIVITIFLVIISGAGLFLSIQKKLSFYSCAYGENVYKSGETVPKYNGDDECYCSSNGAIQCDTGNTGVNYTDYSSKNLKFTYEYLNLLENSSSSSSVVLDSVAYANNTLTLAVERNILCTEDGSVPVQSGLYSLTDGSLTMTVMTGQESQYNTNCKITDTFEIANVNMNFDSNFKIYYQMDDGTLIELKACVYEQGLHADQEVFKSADSKSVCLCDSGTVSCRAL